MPNTDTPNKLTIKEKAFCREYAKTGNGIQSVLKAGYKNTSGSAGVTATRLLKKSNIQAEIARIQDKCESKAIMSGQQVMEMFTKIANGEVKDQFGLDASLNDRIKALQELAKRTIDIDNRIKGNPDTLVQVKIDWKR